MSELHLEENQDNLTPIDAAAEWALNFLNSLGGDFLIIENDCTSISLRNNSACPGLCVGKQNASTCIEIEKTMNDGARYFGSHLTAGFVECSHDSESGCRLVISLILRN